MSEQKLTAQCWLHVQAQRNDYDQVVGAKVVRLTQQPPTITDPDVRLVKLRLQLPAEAFDDLRVLVDVPAELVQVPEVEGEVIDDE
ncbi:hypothetical protein [Brevibacterium gallinarum]|uniref:Uncharacterized protein n=1 Tax=Brevibacterium gallinarum TaxID=2762220 RepID=A0ABR8WQY9_9MICO|nr:hypothetical protein [Brevibacterium gallinarum]MBD8019368.1 hypothetical protein [Brevibacterium gallinarum]